MLLIYQENVLFCTSEPLTKEVVKRNGNFCIRGWWLWLDPAFSILVLEFQQRNAITEFSHSVTTLVKLDEAID
jgi:hypothetical protein